MTEPVILERSQHNLSRRDISPEALKVLERLKQKGFIPYLCGGCVRDLLLGGHPKDFDLATNATPQQLRKIFSNCRLIGRRFRLAHIYFHDDFIEVATFRSNAPEPGDLEKGHLQTKDGLIVRDNLYGTPEEDALRRDFTINALFYDIRTFSIIDYAGGLKDIENRLVRCIGDTDVRYIEDPVRMLRAARFAASLQLEIEEHTYKGILKHCGHLAVASPPRMHEELLKVLYCGSSKTCFRILEESGMLKVMMPDFAEWLSRQGNDANRRWVDSALKLLDDCKQNGFIQRPSQMFSLLFGSYHESLAQEAMDRGVKYGEAMADAIEDHQRRLAARILITQRDMQRMIAIARTQPRFLKIDSKRAEQLREREYFNDAYVYFKFSARTHDRHQHEVNWWDDFVQSVRNKPQRPRTRPARKKR